MASRKVGADKMVLTKHASKRIQQRAIPKNVIDMLWLYGSRIPIGKGMHSVCFASRNEKKYFESDLKAMGINPRKNWSQTYLVTSIKNNTVITAAYARQRRRRK